MFMTYMVNYTLERAKGSNKPLKCLSQLQQMTFLVFFIFSTYLSLDISCESSARQTIPMKCQVFSKNNTIFLFRENKA